MSMQSVEIPFGETTLKLETGRLAKQADASVLATIGVLGQTPEVDWNRPRDGQHRIQFSAWLPRS